MTCALRPEGLTCEYLVNPLGIDTPAPRLSWQLRAEGRGQRQRAYQVLVAGSREALAAGRGELWDSGKVESAQSMQVPYAGEALAARQACWWAVRVWDADDQPSAYSEPACWEMGLLTEADWQAQWIGVPTQHTMDGTPRPAPHFRRTLAVEQDIISARVYVSGLGYHELYINGQKVGDHVLDPLFTRYDVRTLYVAHDVTALLKSGENALGVVLGTGWYNCHTPEVWDFTAAPWRHQPKLLLQLHVTLADGSEQVLVSDASWKVGTGPLVFDGLRNGETYDARLEIPDWAKVGFDDTAWSPVEIITAPGGILTAETLPCRVVETLTPKSVTEVRPGVFVIDIGQNMTGWAQLHVSGPDGTEITLRYAEKLGEDGDIDQSNINVFIKGGDCQTDRYICKGEGVEVWEPRFTYHGFQYVQVTGFPGTPTVDSLRARVVRSAFPSAGTFECSNAMLNAIQQATRWAYVSNFVGIPTDCPHREKNGWTGDAQIAAETGLFNYAAAPAYEKWMRDFKDIQRPSGQLPGIVPTGGWGFNWGSGPAWDSAYLNIPWYLYLYCGDTAVLAEHYAGMQRYLEYMQRMATDGIVSFGLGDWCPPNSGDGYGHDCPIPVTSTGYYYSNCRTLARIAELLGKPKDAARYTALAEGVKAAFTRAFYDPATGRVADGGQTSQACALFQGLVEPAEVERVLARLIAVIAEHDGKLTFGILGAKYVLNALVEYGRPDLAYAFAAQTDYPSWGHWIAQGATTLWEAWEGTSSRNHIMFGDISAWFFKTLAGLRPDADAPGFQHFTVTPYFPADLDWVQAEHDTAYGRIRSAWRREAGSLTLEVEVPVNTTATITLPAMTGVAVTESGQALENAEGIMSVTREDTQVTCTVGSGSYRFQVAAVYCSA